MVEGKAVLAQRRADDVLAKGRIAAFGAHRSMEDFPAAGQRQVNQSFAFLCMDIEPARVRGIVIGADVQRCRIRQRSEGVGDRPAARVAPRRAEQPDGRERQPLRMGLFGSAKPPGSAQQPR